MSFNILDLIDVNHEDHTQPDGEMAVLSVGRGDMKINFNSDDPKEVENARTIVQDMLSRGYMLFVEVNGKTTRVSGFDPSTNEYIIKIDKRSKLWKEHATKDGNKKTTRVSAKKAKGIAVAPTGGG